jgi:AAA+ superfamily predicted ATPase
VLFLDECDSLSLARENSHQRHDYSITNTLLKQIERQDGLVILATNLAGHLDKALYRRVNHHLEFDYPDSAQQALIWKSLIPATVPIVGNLDLQKLGEAYDLSGGEIKNAVLEAANYAVEDGGTICQSILEAAAQNELDRKSGRHKTIGFASAV